LTRKRFLPTAPANISAAWPSSRVLFGAIALLLLNGFDERFRSHRDKDLLLRLLARRFETAITRQVIYEMVPRRVIDQNISRAVARHCEESYEAARIRLHQRQLKALPLQPIGHGMPGPQGYNILASMRYGGWRRAAPSSRNLLPTTNGGQIRFLPIVGSILWNAASPRHVAR